MAGEAAILMTSGMPFCSATCAIAVVWPESKAPIRSCAPSLISFSARARAVSTLDSVSAFMIARSGSPRAFRIGGASSTPRWQSRPIKACKPERGNKTPTFSEPPSARTIAGAESIAAAVLASSVRRFILKGLDDIIGSLPGFNWSGAANASAACDQATRSSLAPLPRLTHQRELCPRSRPFVVARASPTQSVCLWHHFD